MPIGSLESEGLQLNMWICKPDGDSSHRHEVQMSLCLNKCPTP